MTDQEKLDRLHKWLAARGWQQTSYTNRYNALWERGDGTDTPIPFRVDFDDFDVCFALVVSRAAKRERVPEWQLWAELHGWTSPGEKGEMTPAERDLIDLRRHAREAAQILIAEIGAPGPECVEDTARRAAAVIRELRESPLKAIAETTGGGRRVIEWRDADARVCRVTIEVEK